MAKVYTCPSVLCKRKGLQLKKKRVVDDEGIPANVFECKECGYYEVEWLG